MQTHILPSLPILLVLSSVRAAHLQVYNDLISSDTPLSSHASIVLAANDACMQSASNFRPKQ